MWPTHRPNPTGFCAGLSLVALLCFGSCAAANAADKPNIVYIMVDDLGYGSLNSYGASTSLIQTPNIDRLATEGMRFTDASTPSAVCSPTRYGVLMGEYPFRSERKWGTVNINDRLLPDQEQQTMADWLKGQGYSTSAIGKWHLGFQNQGRSAPTQTSSGGWLNAANNALDPGPRALGFDYFFGIPHNHDDRTSAYIENEGIYQLQSQSIDPNPDTSSYGNLYYGFDVPEMVLEDVTETLGQKAVEWLDQQAGSEDPFFLYFNPIAVHEPTTPSDTNAGTSAAGPYGDFIHDMDDSVGAVLDKLDAMGVADNTLVVFTSDNGGHIPGDTTQDEWIAINSGLDLNGPWKGDKSEVWEGGTRVPFLARLPGSIEAGTTNNQTINLVDTFATVVDLVDAATAPAPGAAADSQSFLAALLDADDPEAGRETMITASNQGVLAFRFGDWKYIEGEIPTGSTQTPRADEAQRQLYNLATDPGETTNVLAQNLALADELQGLLDLAEEAGHTLGAPGDLNLDGQLDTTDLGLFLTGWRSNTAQMSIVSALGVGDYNLSGETDLNDWLILRQAFITAGVEIPAGFERALFVPEPGSALLLVALIGGFATASSRGACAR